MCNKLQQSNFIMKDLR